MSSIEKDKAPEDNRKRGRVKWYSERRGYGFIEVDGHEVFIHRTTLNQFGIIRIQNEDIVLITQVKTDRGFIVDTLYGVDVLPCPTGFMPPKRMRVKNWPRSSSSMRTKAMVLSWSRARTGYFHPFTDA